VIGQAGNGLEGIALVRTMQPDIVLMNINMPVMDGIEATQIINMMFPHTPVIMLTAQSGKEYVLLAAKVGAHAYLVKPTEPEELYTTVRTVHTRNKRIQLR